MGCWRRDGRVTSRPSQTGLPDQVPDQFPDHKKSENLFPGPSLDQRRWRRTDTPSDQASGPIRELNREEIREPHRDVVAANRSSPMTRRPRLVGPTAASPGDVQRRPRSTQAGLDPAAHAAVLTTRGPLQRRCAPPTGTTGPPARDTATETLQSTSPAQPSPAQDRRPGPTPRTVQRRARCLRRPATHARLPGPTNQRGTDLHGVVPGLSRPSTGTGPGTDPGTGPGAGSCRLVLFRPHASAKLPPCGLGSGRTAESARGAPGTTGPCAVIGDTDRDWNRARRRDRSRDCRVR